MHHKRPGRVFTLRIVPPAQQTLFESPEEHIVTALAAGKRASKYGREWIVGQTEFDGRILSGRVGFQGEAGSADIWDDEKQDFVPTAIPNGLTAPFAIDVLALTAAMQPRGSVIKINSLIVAFEALLTADGRRWELVGLKKKMSLETWKESVSKVISVKLTIREPNPHYFDANNLKNLMTQMESEAIQLEARNDAKGVNLDAPFLKETEGHISRGYGEGEYRGLREQGSEVRESVYSTRIGAEEESDELPVDPDSGEVSTAGLVAVLDKA